MKVTRREVVGVLLGAPPLLARTQPEPAPFQAPAGQPAQPEAPAELLRAARERVRRNTASLAKTQVPMSTEPAFSFRAL